MSIRTINFLPQVFQTTANQKFLNATLDQLVSEPKFKRVNGYIGRKFAPTFKTSDNYLPEPSVSRQNYQLEPCVVIQDEEKNVKFFNTYVDLLQQIQSYGGDITNHSRLFDNEMYSFSGCVDFDKLVNFSQYYWLPGGPDPVVISAGNIDGQRTFEVRRDEADNAYKFSGFGTIQNPDLTLVRGGIYEFVVNQTSPFWIQVAPGTSGSSIGMTNIDTRAVFGVTNNGANNGTVTFKVPQIAEQEFYINMPLISKVDYGTKLKFNELDNRLLKEVVEKFGGIDGIKDANNLIGKYIVFVSNDLSDASWEEVGIYQFDPWGSTRGNGNTNGKYDAGDVMPFETRTGIWQIGLVDTGNGELLINLTPVRDIPVNNKVAITSGYKYANREFFKNEYGEILEMPLITTTLEHLYYNDGTDQRYYGRIRIVDSANHTLNVDEDILGKKEYISPNGVEFSNGIKVKFDNQVVPESYANNEFYVQQVGKGIRLVSVTNLITPELEYLGASIPYDVYGFTNDFFDQSLNGTYEFDYITIDRSSVDNNPWSRSNRWFHIDVLAKTAEHNMTVPEFDQSKRATRPIIEFEPDIKLFNHGTVAKHNINVVDFTLTDALNQLEGELHTSQVDKSKYYNDERVIFSNDIDPEVRNKVWRIVIELEPRQRIGIDGIGMVDEHGDPIMEDGKYKTDPETGEYVLDKNGNKILYYMYKTLSREVYRNRIDETDKECDYYDFAVTDVTHQLDGWIDEDVSYFEKANFKDGMTVVFARDKDPTVRNKVWKVNVLNINKPRVNMFGQQIIDASGEPIYDDGLYVLTPTGELVRDDNGNKILIYKYQRIHLTLVADGNLQINDTIIPKTATTVNLEPHRVEPMEPEFNPPYTLPLPPTMTLDERNTYDAYMAQYNAAYLAWQDDHRLWEAEKFNVSSRRVSLDDGLGDVPLNGIFSLNTGMLLGYSFWYDGTKWITTQRKVAPNTTPMFDIIDNDYNSFGDATTYKNSTFTGCKIFSYKVGAGTVDKELGFALSYRDFNNVGDIQFENNFDTDTFTNLVGVAIVPHKINSGFIPLITGRTSTKKSNIWVNVAEHSKQYQIISNICDGNTSYFEIDILADKNNILPNLRVFLNNKQLLDTEYEILDVASRKALRVIATIGKGDKVDILMYSSAVSDLGYYEIPKNLDYNPLNANFATLTLGQFRNHLVTIAHNFTKVIGEVPGRSNFRNLDIKPAGGNILQHSAPLIYSSLFLLNKEVNFVDSLTLAQKEYSKFKNRFLEMYASVIMQNISDPRIAVDYVMAQLNSAKNHTLPWYNSDMIPYDQDKTIINYTVLDLEQTEYEIDKIFDDSEFSNKAILVYLDGEQLVKGTDYSFSQVRPSIVFHNQLAYDQIIDIHVYNNTDGCYVPETPTKLGLYPKFKPVIYRDNSYTTPVDVIRGHDGSTMPVFGDIRDAMLLELERRIYNNVKAQYNPDIFDINSFIPGRFRKTDYSRAEFNTIVARSFLSWIGNNRIDYSSNKWFASSEPWTWTYNKFKDRIDGSYLPGYWRGIYKYFYDTDAPNERPWEMLGFGERPDWWEPTYGPSPYTGGNMVLWKDLEYGIIRGGNKIGAHEQYARPGLSKYIPVTDTGLLRDPAEFLITQINYADASASFEVGDEGPVETAWRRSSDYPFAIQYAVALMKPAKYFGLLANMRNYSRDNELEQYLLLENNQRLAPGNFKLNGKPVNGIKSRVAGYLNWIVDNVTYNGADPYTVIPQYLDKMEVRLGYRAAGFTDKSFLKVLAEQSSPSSTNDSVIIPTENYLVHLHKSSSVTRLVYSAVIVEKTDSGYSVSGYNTKYPFFTIIPSEPNSNSHHVVVDNTTVTIFNDYVRELVTIPYGHQFTSKQQVADFLIAYGRYLQHLGFQFEEFDTNLQETKNWVLSVKEFMTWSLQGWGPSSIIVLSPVSNTINLVTDNAVVDQIDNMPAGSKVLDVGFNVVRPHLFSAIRDGNEFSLTVSQDISLGLVDLNLVQYEHALIFDNQTVFNDIIYKPELGNRQYRLKLIGNKTDDWTGQLNPPGFIFSSNNLNTWSTGQDYRKGDIVSFKTQVYTAMQNIDASDSFQYSKWKQIDADSINTGLLPNFAYNAKKFENMYDLDNQVQDDRINTYSNGLIGYRSRNYLTDLSVTSTSQAKFYQGYIKDKGTKDAFTALSAATFNTLSGNIEFNEEWAFRVGDYGATESRQFIEVQLKDSDFVHTPLSLALLHPGELVDSSEVVGIYKDTLYAKPISYTPHIFKNRDDSSVYENDIVTAGYVNLTDIDASVFDINDATALKTIVGNVISGYKIWVAKDIRQDWNVYRTDETSIRVKSFTYHYSGYAVLETDFPHSMRMYDLFAVKGFSSVADGFYAVLGLVDLTKVLVATLPEFDNELLSSPATSDGALFRLNSLRTSHVTGLTDYVPVHGWNTSDKLWVDSNTADGKWAVFKKEIPWVFSSSSIPSVEVLKEDTYGQQVALSLDGGIILVSAPGKDENNVKMLVKTPTGRFELNEGIGVGIRNTNVPGVVVGNTLVMTQHIAAVSAENTVGGQSSVRVYNIDPIDANVAIDVVSVPTGKITDNNVLWDNSGVTVTNVHLANAGVGYRTKPNIGVVNGTYIDEHGVSQIDHGFGLSVDLTGYSTIGSTAGIKQIDLTYPGSGYTTDDVITVTIGNTSISGVDVAGYGAQASANVVIDSSNGATFTGIDLVFAGSGYSTLPNVTITGNTLSGNVATATVNTNWVNEIRSNISGVALTNVGSGYTAKPTVVINGDGNGAVIDIIGTSMPAQKSGLTDVILLAAGHGYTARPTVTVSGGDGTGALATAVGILSGGSITAASLTSAGIGYTSRPSIIVIGDCEEQAYLKAEGFQDSNAFVVTGITVVRAGLGYKANPSLVFVDGGAVTQATGSATVSATHFTLTAVDVVYAGSGYSVAPLITVTANGAGGGAVALGVVDYRLPYYRIDGIALIDGGHDYLDATIQIVSSDGNGSGAEAIIELNSMHGYYEITDIILDPGTGYIDIPEITITGDVVAGGTGAIALPKLQFPVTIDGINIDNPGVGYVVPPVISISNPTSGTQAQAVVPANGVEVVYVYRITDIIVNSLGQNYMVPPTVSITSGDGYGEGAEAAVIFNRSTFGKHIALSKNDQWMHISAPSASKVYSYKMETVQDGFVYASSIQGPFYTEFGGGLATSADGQVIAVGAPHTNITSPHIAGKAGTVYVYRMVNDVATLEQIIEPPFGLANGRFGYSVCFNKGTEELLIGTPGMYSGQYKSGMVYRYANISSTGFDYELVQEIKKPFNSFIESFGSLIAVDSTNNTMFVSSYGAHTLSDTLIDTNTTPLVLDGGVTTLYDLVSDTGAVYVYDLLDSPVDSMYVFTQQLTGAGSNVGDDFGHTMAAFNNTVVVGSPYSDFTSTEIDTGKVTLYTNASKKKGWDKIRQEESKVDVYNIGRMFLHNRKTHNVTANLDFIDPIKGRILGTADQDITYKTVFDPAIYNVGVDTDGVNIDESYHWGVRNVGQVWWDLDKVRYIDYEQDTLNYRIKNWGRLFTGSQIIVAEWVESAVKPSAYAGNGTALYPDDSAYVQITNDGRTKYYFWVIDKTTVEVGQNFRTISVASIAKLISSPTTENVAYAAVLKDNAIALFNSTQFLSSDDTILHVDYQVIDTDNLIHNEYELVTENAARAILPHKIVNKFVDSITGADKFGNIVPDYTLPQSQQYGINIRPRQTMFANRITAVKNFVQYVNYVMAQRPIAEEFNITPLFAAEPAPTNWDPLGLNISVQNLTERSYLNVDNLQTTQRILVVNDEVFFGQWSVYEVTSTKEFKLLQTQSFRTTDYWSKTDWFDESYDPTVKPKFTVEATYDITKLPLVTGDIVWVKNNGAGQFIVYRVDGFTDTQSFKADGRFLEVIKIYQSLSELLTDTTPMAIAPGQFAMVDGNNLWDNDLGKIYRWDGSAGWTFIVKLKTTELAGVSGLAGTRGPGDRFFEIVKSYQTVDDLLNDKRPKGIADGQIAIIETVYKDNTDNNRIYMWDGTTYQYITNLTNTMGYQVRKWQSIELPNSNVILSMVGIQNGTIQLSEALWAHDTNQIGYNNDSFDTVKFDLNPTVEFRHIIDALQNSIFVDSLDGHFNKSFFLMMNYILSEQRSVDWAFKSSFISILHKLRKLDQFPNYIRDNQSFYEEYINEVKPYRTKIRQYLINYEGLDYGKVAATDFDLPSYFDADYNSWRSPSGEHARDELIIASNGRYVDWKDNHTYTIESVDVSYAGRGCTADPVATVTGGGLPDGSPNHAKLQPVIDWYLGTLTKVIVLDPGKGYTSTPTITLSTSYWQNDVTGQFEDHTPRVYPRLSNNKVRSFDIAVKFDRVSYESDIKTWTANSPYKIGEIVSYQNKAYRVNTMLCSGDNIDWVNYTMAQPWMPYTSYKRNDVVLNNNIAYRVGFDFTTIDVFEPLKFVAVTGTLPPAIDVPRWKAYTTYNINDVVSYEEISTGLFKYVLVNTLMTSGTFFNPSYYDLQADGSLQTAADRTMIMYQPNSRMLPKDLKQLFTGTEYPGNLVDGSNYVHETVDGSEHTVHDDGTTTEIDTNIQSALKDTALGTRPEDIDIDGGKYVDYFSSHAPEELVPGLMYDTLEIRVFTIPPVEGEEAMATLDRAANPETPVMGYRMFKPMSFVEPTSFAANTPNANGITFDSGTTTFDTSYKWELRRISYRATTLLAEDLLITDTEIHVLDASKLPEPNPDAAVPGVVYIDGERITYYQIDTVTNKLYQIRRGTWGTGAPAKHVAYTPVEDGSAAQELPRFTYVKEIDEDTKFITYGDAWSKRWQTPLGNINNSLYNAHSDQARFLRENLSYWPGPPLLWLIQITDSSKQTRYDQGRYLDLPYVGFPAQYDERLGRPNTPDHPYDIDPMDSFGGD